MDEETKSVISPGTSLVYPYYDDEGKLCAVLLKDGDFIRVDKSPTEIVDLSMQFYGTSLRGGIDGGKALMGKIHMTPVMVNERLDMYFFPSNSPSSNECVWFSLSHILTFLPFDKKHTKVIFRDGNVFTVNCSYSVFQTRYQRACMLKNGLSARFTQMALGVRKGYKTYLIRKNHKRGNYEISDE
ncbi:MULTISPECIES: competence protein ComK [Sporosarcina]|uniref:Competence transcription factor n=1 Tax=Sporosarcina ureae TaxID=1571 RepID=A0ABM6JXW5_SPOUR|nr:MULTISPECIES: competence protein ComK [Sporosarcina]ARF15104.1 hypothetical protein SporoS204_13655 [Sporosarcina ureae]PIC56285.1 competence protein [Sporosarcina sp. P10]PIC59529.1 competence protein [Sporosarcina sp. P12(2017)]